MKKLFAWGAAILLATAIASLVVALPVQDSYCTICGAQERTQPFGLRFTALTVFRSHQIRATPFSVVLTEKHLVSAHPHQWHDPRLVPDPMDEIGPPVLESLEFINAPRVVHFMRNVADYADPVSVAQWQERMLQPQTARMLDAALRFMQVPAEGFPDRTTFLTWWGQNAYAVSNRLREVTEPD